MFNEDNNEIHIYDGYNHDIMSDLQIARINAPICNIYYYIVKARHDDVYM